MTTSAPHPGIAILVALLVGQATMMLSAPAVDPPENPAAATAAQHDLVDWAQYLYADRGFHLPSLAVSFHETSADCGGRFAVYGTNGSNHEIRMCTGGNITSDRTRQLIVHELGHAWAARNMDQDEREAFVALRGAESWNDPGTAWRNKATEHAAEILAWLLLDEYTPLIPNRELADLVAAVRFLRSCDDAVE